jgi:hydrogenase small subunit
MQITRRDFLKFCGISAAALGFNATDLVRLKEVLANPAGPNVIWLQGAGCTGCSESFLNRIAPDAPQTAADVLINSINLAYHPTLMALAGESAVAEVTKISSNGPYFLVVEGGGPTKFSGNACWAWSPQGKDVTFLQAILNLASRAAGILCIGNCAAWGGIPAAPPNPAGVKGVKGATGRSTINIAGCPPHPDWVVWVIAQILLGRSISLDSSGRPRALYDKEMCERCPREDSEEARTFGQDRRCLEELGCRGPHTLGRCPLGWNNRANFCMEANAPCIGCTDPQFPFTALHAAGESDGHDD